MTDLLERLAAANPVRMDDLAPSIEDVWLKLDDTALAQPWTRLPRMIGTPRRRRLKRLVPVGGGSVAVGAAVLMLGTTGRGPSSAFAGWTATPTGPTSGETAGALDHCTSQLARSVGGPSGIPAGGWQPVVTDTRGPFTTMVLQSGSTSATCINGPSFTSTAANDIQPRRGSQQRSALHTVSADAVGGSAPPSVSMLELGGSRSGPIGQASEARLITSGEQHYTLVQGHVVAGVTRVTLVLSDGSNVKATVAGQSFIAWWPGRATASSAQVENAAGASTQQLTFTRLPDPPAERATSPHDKTATP